jgi:hypothetical protein
MRPIKVSNDSACFAVSFRKLFSVSWGSRYGRRAYMASLWESDPACGSLVALRVAELCQVGLIRIAHLKSRR